jgi:hypothetical protein
MPDLPPESGPFRLESPPNELWNRRRLAGEFGVDEGQIDRWVVSGYLPRPWCRRGRFKKPMWAPEQVVPVLNRHRRHTGRGA